MKKLIVANWKMYPKNAREALAAFVSLKKNLPVSRTVNVAIAPPFMYLSLFPKNAKMALAAQDIFWEAEGSFTGEISGAMLKNAGTRYVIIGHSERRKYLGETDDMVNKKVKYALKAGLSVILCIGEQKRDADGVFYSIIKAQLSGALKGVPASQMPRVAVAYEPVWAIGTGKPARPKDAEEASLYTKKIVAKLYGAPRARVMRVLYGGSVNAQNAGSFLAEREIAGLLVGRESRNIKEFIEIVRCAQATS